MARPIIGRFPRSLDALNHGSFRHYWLAQLGSVIGSWMQITAQSWLVFDLIPDPTEAALKFGYVGAVQFAPTLVLGLFAGVVIDARSRRQVLLTTQSALALSAATMAVLTLTGALTYGWLLVLAAFNGVAGTFDTPARQSLIPDLVPREHVRNAVALNSLSFNLARLLGPVVAAAAIGLFGHLMPGGPLLRYGPAFAINAASYLGVIVVLALAPLPTRPIVPHRVFAEIREGLRFTLRTPEVRIATLLVGALSLTIVNFQTIVPLFARQALNGSVGDLGLLLSSLGVGAFIAFVVNASFPDEARLVLMRRGVLLLGASFVLFTQTPNLWTAAVVLVACGLGMILTMVNAQATVQLMVPDALRGRAMSVYMLVFSGLIPFGALLATQLAGHLGVRTGLFVLGVVGLVATLSMRPHRGDIRRANERLQATTPTSSS
ncbi:MAG: MFS transporter [Deinococcales bacterium]